jgi:hypothetical protein
MLELSVIPSSATRTKTQLDIAAEFVRSSANVEIRIALEIGLKYS